MTEANEITVVIAVADVAGFTKACGGKSDLQAFNMLNRFYHIASTTVGKAGGTVVKFMGDGVLVVFPEERMQQAIASIRQLVTLGNDAWSEFDPRCRVRFKAHIGSVVLGPMGPEQRIDVVGNTLNHLFRMTWDGPEISDELKQRLEKQ